MKVPIFLFFFVYLLSSSLHAQEVNNTINCGESNFFFLAELPETCIYATTLAGAKNDMKAALIKAIDEAYDVKCVNSECPPKPNHILRRCDLNMPADMPRPTVTVSGDSLIFCFTFLSTFFELGCNDCNYYRRYPFDPPLNDLGNQSGLDWRPTKVPIRMFPNPAKDQVMVQYSLPHSTDEVHWQLYNLQGQLVKSASLGQQQAGDYIFQIDTQAFPSGIYSLQIHTKKGSLGIQKLLLQPSVVLKKTSANWK